MKLIKVKNIFKRKFCQNVGKYHNINFQDYFNFQAVFSFYVFEILKIKILFWKTYENLLSLKSKLLLSFQYYYLTDGD